jgi:polyhydroxyalkanoate synthesis regulator phasin
VATTNDRSILQRLFDMGEERFNKLVEELISNPRFAESLGKAVQTAVDTKGKVDRNMQTLLGLLNLPSKSDYRKLSMKIEALQGSLVNLNIKLDRLLAQKPAAAARAAPAGKPKRSRSRRSTYSAAGDNPSEA